MAISRTKLACVCLTSLVVAPPAVAATLTATISGTVATLDPGNLPFNLNVFGAGFQLLDGQAFSVVYTFDLDQASYSASYDGPFSPAQVLAGGAFSPVPSAGFGSAALTINGQTVSFDGISFGSVTAGTGERTFNVIDFSQPGQMLTVATNLFDPSLSFPAALDAAGSWSGPFDLAADRTSASPSSFYVNLGDGRLAAGGLTPDSLSIALAAVPEPSSWAMMIAGVGAVGGTLRRAARRPSRIGATA
jgi:hypothetical protein